MNQGERAARERVEAVYTAVDRLTPDDLAWSSFPARDLEARAALLADLERDVGRVGRRALLDEARGWLRDAIAQRVTSRASYAESGAIGLARMARPGDIANIALALEDAVSVAVAEDLLRPADAAALGDPGRRLLRMEPLPASPMEPVPPAGAWEPSATDWAAATDDGPSAVDRDEPMGGSRTMQRTFFGLVGGFAVVAALGIGFGNEQPLLGILGAGAAAALAWTFATWRSSSR